MQGSPGLPNPPASKARALEIKLEKWWKRKIILQVGFVFGLFGFLIMRGSAVSHGFTGALDQPGSWVTEGGKRGH